MPVTLWVWKKIRNNNKNLINKSLRVKDMQKKYKKHFWVFTVFACKRYWKIYPDIVAV